jgi:tetratricopeptide (TPR) repeat protein
MTIRISALFLAFVLQYASGAMADQAFDETMRGLEHEWAVIYYQMPEDQQAPHLKQLLARATAIREHHAGRAEPLILEAIILATYAGADWGLSSLSRVDEARELLQKAIQIDPAARDAAAYITLGSLYYHLPGWPLSFGDNTVARRYFQAAVMLRPDNLDSNFFYGNFLLNQGEYDAALHYLERADRAPVRPNQAISDAQIRDEVKQALANAREKHGNQPNMLSRYGSKLNSGKSK